MAVIKTESHNNDIIMSSISGISSVSAAANVYLTNALQTNLNQSVKDFQALGSALQSGNLSAAKTAFNALQKDLPAGLQAASSQPFGGNSQANTDYQNLTTALRTGDLTTAQKAFTLLQTDLKGTSTDPAGNPLTSPSFGSILNGVLHVGT
jgi:DNA-binding FadR family transcriptional regulator